MDTQPAAEAPAPAIDIPSVPLPPAALRLENLDFDATGIPYYKFPPFLSPPEGVTLIPFKSFKPRGIQITLDTEEEEVDGDGVPTVQLGAKHNIDEKDGEKKKKRRKNKKETDEPKKSSPWWDDWAEGEDLRTASVFDPNVPRIERFAAGAAEFAQSRKFSPALQSLYDHFRLFSGLLITPKHDKYGKGGDEDDADDEVEDDEAEFNADHAAAAQESEENPNASSLLAVDRIGDEAHIEEVDEEQDLLMNAFLNDTEMSVKIFFSSYYKDKGLAWSEHKLRDGPFLLSFFLAFFVRNRIMPDYERAFIKAHKAVELARFELPQTAKISMSLPDVFGRACTALWESVKPQGWSEDDTMDVDAATSKEVMPDPVAGPGPVVGLDPVVEPASEPASQPIQEWESQLQARGLEKVDVDLFEPSAAVSNRWGDLATEESEVGGLGMSNADRPMVGGWGDAATVMPADLWGVADGAGDWDAGERTPSLMEILGPTTLPLTHALQRAEKATREIVAFSPPRAEGTGLDSVLGTVVLAPWKRYYKGSPITRPQMLLDKAAGSTFDPKRDLIRAFVDPQVVDVLQEGMGLHGIFVQVAQEGINAPKEKKSKSRGKARGKAKGADDREWWYVEFLYEVIPSFWTEDGELE